MAEKILQVKNLQVSFRTKEGLLKAVRDVSFDLYKGETLSIVGESGSGKSVTSKAIIGILSGNSVVEGGEILYGGKDLLKIPEEEFHKIRGDKISMIFQDPLSALNPIMKVGKQVTEAMILNGNARQKNARYEFNYYLNLLKKYLDIVNEDKEKNLYLYNTMKSLCIKSSSFERTFVLANENLFKAKNLIENTAFLIEKKQKVNLKNVLYRTTKYLKKAVNSFLIKDVSLIDNLTSYIFDYSELTSNEIDELLTKVSKFINSYVDIEKPNFMHLAYIATTNPSIANSDLTFELSMKECPGLDKFEAEFTELGKKAITYAHEESINKKRTTIKLLYEFRDYLNSIDSLDDKKAFEYLKLTKKAVKESIEYMSPRKHSVEYSCGISLDHEFNRYLEGLKKNPKNIKKHNVQQRKFDHLVQTGKNPSWKVVPAYLIDLELTKSNVVKIVSNLITRYEKDFSKEHDADKYMTRLTKSFEENASRMVQKITRNIAKAKALNIFEEVGIPEAKLRFNQFPFEFSGGMRQRVVIAIALAANPDILICDEPTTALDVTIQSQILELINKIKKERNLSVIFITHDLGVVANMADRIAVMYAGKIVEYGTANDVFYDPRHPYTWALLSSMPDLDTKEKLEAIPGTPPNMIYPPIGDAFADRNKYALKIDYEMQPPLFEISETHFAATWLLHPDAPKVNPPKIVMDRIARMRDRKKRGEQ